MDMSKQEMWFMAIAEGLFSLVIGTAIFKWMISQFGIVLGSEDFTTVQNVSLAIGWGLCVLGMFQFEDIIMKTFKIREWILSPKDKVTKGNQEKD
jgi:hypothetical protein